MIAPEDRREFITSVMMALAGLFACGIIVLIASLIVSTLILGSQRKPTSAGRSVGKHHHRAAAGGDGMSASWDFTMDDKGLIN